MGLSARIFGFSSWSLLVPQALEGVAAVGLLAAAVRRVAGPAAGLIAGAALALTPAAVLIFRFDNPDAFLVLLLVAAAYCVTRALESARTWWLAAAAGWWILAVLLRLAADRPYTGGSTDSNPLELAFGYNGLGPLLGGGGSGAAGSGFGGTAGLQRLFTGEFGLEISWLLPAAVLLLAAGIWLTWGRRRTDPARAGLLVWGGWLVVTAVTFSYMKGTIHPYYTVALAPAIAALTGIGLVLLWRHRGQAARRSASAVLAAVVVVTGGWDVILLRSGSSSFSAPVAVIAVVILLTAVLALAVTALRSPSGQRRGSGLSREHPRSGPWLPGRWRWR